MQGPRILLVCEEENTASDLAGRLRELGYAVPRPFVTVREALAELEEGVRPDLFLLDLDLQGDLSGKVLARLVRERFDLPVVFLGTGERGEEDPEEVDSFGYLGKPVRDRELAAALLMALHRRDLETRLRETELRHRAFLDNLKTEVAVFRRDAQGTFRLRELNRAAERRRGEDRESLLGRTCEEYLPELGDWLRERLHRVVRSGKGEDFSLPLREDTGVQWREGAVFPLQAGEAGVLFRDVTVLRRQTEALMRSARDLTERLRECRSLLEIARTLQEPFLALDERLCRAAELVPRAFRAPETLEARILLGDREYATRHFLNTPWSTSQGIFVEGALEGAVEVCRRTLEEPDQEERFLREELDFLRSLAGLLGQTVQREREIRRAEQVRDLAFAGLLLGDPCAGVLLLDPQGRVLEAEFPDRALPEGLRRIQGCRLDEVAPEVAGSLPEASPEAEGVLSLSLGGGGGGPTRALEASWPSRGGRTRGLPPAPGCPGDEVIPMALVGDDAARQKLLEENLDRLLKNLEASSPVVAKDLIPPEGVEGTYRVSVAPDRFSATVDLFPPLGGGKPLDWITLVDELNGQGFVALLAESLSQAVDRCNQGAPQKGILVAQGIPPKLPREARLEILFSLEAPRETEEPPEDEDSQVDYRDRGHILAVREGDPLAILEPAEAGVPGVDVFGIPVPVEPPQDVRLLPGKGVILGEDGKTFVATQTGQPVLDGAVLRVDPVYVVSSDVDLGTGNVVFEGSVLVRGNVREGFVVTAGVDLEVFGNVEGARLQAARDVVIHGGLLGQGASVEAGRDVKARHVEHGKVYADRDILVTQYALHGSLFACGSILFQGRKGVIGGSLEAYDRIDVFTAGTPLGTKTHLLAGSHFRVRQQLGGVRERSEDLEAQTARIGSVIKTTLARYTRDGRPTLPPELADRMEKLLAHYNKLVEEARALEGRRHALEGLLRPQTSNKGIIKIRGTVYPGVLVEIRGKKREILDKQRFVSFYLDQDQQELTFGPYQ